MTLEEIKYNSPKYHKSVELRYKILREPLGMTYSEEFLKAEKNQHHLGLFIENQIVAILLLQDLGNKLIKMRQFAVNDQLQGKGFGTKLVKFSEKIIKEKGFNKIELNARQTAVRFYEKLNYQIVSDEFFEVGIPHYKMEKEL